MSEQDDVTRFPPPERAFIGLDAYVETDSTWFSGREEEVEQLRALVSEYPFVLLTGYTGVGKTSLIKAGLFPLFRPDDWHCVHLSLADLFAPDQVLAPQHPLVSSTGQPGAEALAHQAGEESTRNASRPVLPHQGLRDLFDQLVGEASPPGTTFESAYNRLTQHHPDQMILVAFDQFEALAQGDQAVAADFALALEGIVAGRWPDLRLLVVYRGDAEPDVGPLLQRAAGLVGGPPRRYLLPLSSEAAAHILGIGFEAAGVTISDENLLSTILYELGSLPVVPHVSRFTSDSAGTVFPSHLQMVGHTLCQLAGENQGVLTEDLYGELGGAQGIVTDYLARQLERFDERRSEAEKVLVALVQHGPQSERQLRDATVLTAELAYEDWSQLLADLAAARLIRREKEPSGDAYVQVIHEALAEMIRHETVRQERELRRLRGTLALRAAGLEHGPVVMRSDVMAELYLWRDRIVPSPNELRLLLFNGLMEHGPAWYWLRRVPLLGVRPFLIQAYESSFAELHRAGGLALAAAATVKDALTLKEILDDGDAQVREAAARALTQVVPEMGVEDALMLRYLIEVSDDRVRRVAAQALARILAQVGRDIIPYLPEMLRDEDPEVRYIADQALHQVTDWEDVPLLRQMLQDEDLNVLNAAWGVLTQVLSRAPRQNLDQLLAMLTDDDPYVQGAAREALTDIIGSLSPPGELKDEALLRELSQSDDPNVRRAATLTLVATLAKGGPATISELRPMLDDWDADVRRAAGQALANELAQLASSAPDEADAMSELRAMMDSPDRPLRVAFAQVVTRLLAERGRESIPELRRLLDDADPEVRQAARSALEEVLAQVGREAIPELQAMLKDPNWDVWQAAGLALARVLSELGRPGLRDLRGLLKEGEDPEVRRAGGQALAGVLRDLGRVSVPELQMMLNDQDECVQRAAGQALAQVLEDAGLRGMADLRRLLQREDPEIQEPARQALIGIAARLDLEALPVLRELLADQHPAVRDAAEAALGHVAQALGRRTLPYLREMLHDRYPAQRRAAATTIAALDPVRGLAAWAELVMTFPLDNEFAARALVALDRQLYCSFAENWKTRIL